MIDDITDTPSPQRCPQESAFPLKSLIPALFITTVKDTNAVGPGAANRSISGAFYFYVMLVACAKWIRAGPIRVSSLNYQCHWLST